MFIAKPKRDRNRMAVQRRRNLSSWTKFNLYHAFKTRIKHGRRNPIHWWG